MLELSVRVSELRWRALKEKSCDKFGKRAADTLGGRRWPPSIKAEQSMSHLAASGEARNDAEGIIVIACCRLCPPTGKVHLKLADRSQHSSILS